MRSLTGAQIAELLNGLIHDKTQVGPFHVDLTVAEVHRFTKRGTLDFGGSELVVASGKPLHPRKKNGDDKYGWWELHQGLYRVVYNECVKDGLGDEHLIEWGPHLRLLQAGATHAACSGSPVEGITSILQVSQAGCALKQNCRISRLRIRKLD